jgi:hypothetical protein
MRYALAKPRILSTSMTLAAVMATSLLLASSALAWDPIATTPASTASSLNAVSCVGDVWAGGSTQIRDCYGWGNYTVASGATTGAGAKLSSNLLGTYTLGSSPSGSSPATIRGVECAPGPCVQVGEHKGFAIATGSNLAVALAPTGAVTSRLNAVSCSGAGCLAVGQYTDSAGHSHGYMAARSGAGPWFVNYQHLPTETQDSALTGVSCAGLRCLVVGTHTNNTVNGTITYGIALTYTWSTGAIATATLPTAPGFRQLNGISCADTGIQTKCEVVGSQRTTLTGTVFPVYLQTTFTSPGSGAVTYTVEPGTPAAPAAATTTRLNATSCYWTSSHGFGCRVVGDSNATGSVQPYVGTLTTAAVQPTGTPSATATGTSCFNTSTLVTCDDVGTSTTSGVTQAFYQELPIP